MNICKKDDQKPTHCRISQSLQVMKIAFYVNFISLITALGMRVSYKASQQIAKRSYSYCLLIQVDGGLHHLPSPMRRLLRALQLLATNSGPECAQGVLPGALCALYVRLMDRHLYRVEQKKSC